MGNNEDLVGAIGRLIERVDLYEGDEGEALNGLPLDDHPFLDEDVDIKVFIEELRFAMEQQGVTVGEVSLVDEAGNEHPLPLPAARQSWHMQYLLDARGQAMPADDFKAVVRLLRNLKKRTVARTIVRFRSISVEIRTIFTVANLAVLPGAAPVLWESMVFSRHIRVDYTKMRYTSVEEAKDGHEWLVAYTRKFFKKQRPRRRPTIHQAAAMLRRQRRGKPRKRGAR